METLGIVGCGRMGQAFLSRIAPNITARIWCCDVSDASLMAVRQIVGDRVFYTKSVDDIAQRCDVVLVAVKPAQAPTILPAIAKGSKKAILSIMAGVRYGTLCELAPGCEIVRIMPNTPALVGAGATVVLNNGMSTEIRRLLESLLPLMGGVHFVTDESMLDAATGLSGSGPALLAMVAEAMADAGVAEGLPRDLARDLARETMLGTARLMEVQHPEVLKENVMSPHGTTAAGVLAAEKAGLRHAAAEFVSAASRRAREL